MKTAIELLNLSHFYNEKKVLDNIDLKIGTGEIFGLLGPSGAGKTTMINIITGQLKQSSGRVTMLGNDTENLTGTDYKKMGMMLDNFGLYERLSCYDNLRLITRLYQIPKNRITEVLEQVGLSEASNQIVLKLSKGMKQRLALARAILSNPEILFLDEPTSGLDPMTSLRIHELIREQRDKGVTIFLTTHNMEEASKLCDHIALLHEGNIVEYGEPGDICKRYNHQNKLHILLYNGEQIILENSAESAEKVRDYIAQGSINTIHSSEPDLETVFMELTGRGFE